MNELINALKDILLVISPIIVAYISYRSNKNTEKDIRLELEKSLREKNAETEQILQRINAELDSQKQLEVWKESLPQTDEYTQLAGTERYGNICALPQLINAINYYMATNNLTNDELCEIREYLLRIKLPLEAESIYPYEVISILQYKNLIRRLDAAISSGC